MRRFWARFHNVFDGGRAERELAREVESHLGLLQETFERRGLTPEEARLAARREYGGIEQAKELHRDMRSFPWAEQLRKDLRYGWRSLLRTPGFTAIALFALALGIGANLAIFSVVSAVLLNPLAYKNADNLVTVLHHGTGPVSPANYIDWRDQNRSFEALGAAEFWSPNLVNNDPPEHLLGLHVTQNLFPMLGIHPLLGRWFAVGEDRKGAEHEVILSYSLWARRFGSDPKILGKPMDLNGEEYTIVGVMPREFKFAPFWATGSELWAPLAFGDRIEERSGNSLRIFGRLKPGVSLAQARAEMAIITARLEKRFPGTNREIVVTPLKENVVGNIETPLLLVLGAVGFVLLIACANVAHMLLARTGDRKREIAVRAALGASRGRITRQLFTENLLLAGGGAAAGLLLAFLGTKALIAASPVYIPRVETVAIDGRAILFLIGITALTVILFGLAPAIRAAAGNLSGSLKEGGRAGSDSMRRNRLRTFLVISEFALTFVLLVGAGLMIRSFFALQSINPGFDPHHVLSMIVSVAGSKEADAGRREIFYRQLIDHVRALPGVQNASGINHLPLAGDLWTMSFAIEGRPKPRPGEAPEAVYRIVMPGYFETMRLPIVRGRAIGDRDDSRAQGVVVINEQAAVSYWPGKNPIGERIAMDGIGRLTVVGIAKNAAEEDWAAKPAPEIYLSALQSRDFLGDGGAHMAYITLVARTSGDPAQLSSALKQTVWSFDRNLPISDVLTMEDAIANKNAEPRFEMFLLGVFAGIALILAAVGIYGVMAYSVSRRTKEIGIRISLGAARAEVLRMVLWQGVTQSLIGSAMGAAAAFLLANLMEKVLYGVRPTDTVTFLSVGAILSAAALLAAYLPARKATRIDPMMALRNE
ncbi:MAG TPA: ABC transporter permease [Bryobacteraceae bacterium]|nr:ABC transporter permease [Bryobacteraceae bacterium]